MDIAFRSSLRGGVVVQRPIAQFALGLSGLALVTLVCFWMEFDVTPTAFLYLVVILVLSLVSSLMPLAALSILAVAALNYFFVAPRFFVHRRATTGRGGPGHVPDHRARDHPAREPIDVCGAVDEGARPAAESYA